MIFRFLAVFLVIVSPAFADTAFRLPHIIGDHMVLQAGQPDALWGWAPAGSTVKADFLDGTNKVLAEAEATAASDGKWLLKLPAVPTGTAGMLRFTNGTQTTDVKDVLAGEVWFCGGQSNMTYDFGSDNMIQSERDAANKQAAAQDGAIRIFHTDGASSDTPQDDSGGGWYVAAPNQLGFCVAWYFAVGLREKVPQPVGLVECAVGGTRVEQWTVRDAVAKLPDGPAIIKREEDYRTEIAQKDQPHAAWLAANPTPELQKQNKASEPQRFWPPPIVGDLYNGMRHGLQPYGLRGILWFQADGNLGSTPQYGELVKGLITNWRDDFQANLPFYYVEMNNMRDDMQHEPVVKNELSQLREAQDIALELPGTDVVSSIDCSIPEQEPHFPLKEPVGRRLAAVALDHVYGIKQTCHGPTYASMAVEGNTIRLKFTDADDLRVRGGGQMRGFAIRGATGDWVWAQGKVDGNDVVLWSDKVPLPAAVRYAWAPNPVISMENSTGFPMRPFRTDKDSPQ